MNNLHTYIHASTFDAHLFQRYLTKTYTHLKFDVPLNCYKTNGPKDELLNSSETYKLCRSCQ